jgi:hypothetical protein
MRRNCSDHSLRVAGSIPKESDAFRSVATGCGAGVAVKGENNMDHASGRPPRRRLRSILGWILFLLLIAFALFLVLTPRELVTPGRVSQVTVGMPRDGVRRLLGPTTLEQMHSVGLMAWSVGTPKRDGNRWTSRYMWSRPGGVVYYCDVTCTTGFHHGRAEAWASPALYVMVCYDENNRVIEVTHAPARINERWTGPWHRRVQNYLLYWKARWEL